MRAGPLPRSRPVPFLLLLGAASVEVLATPASSVAQEAAEACNSGRISYIFIDNHSVFDTSEETEDKKLRWAYKVANFVHVRTRQSFLETELLFETGDCYDPFLLSESARILRAHRFIASADVFGVPQPDGTHHVVVDTWDEWTTRLNLGVAIDDGIEFRRVELREENFLGRGILLGVFFRERREQQERGIEVATPRLFHTRWDARFSFGRTRVGDFFAQELRYPFVGEVGAVAARQQVGRRETLFAYSTPGDTSFTNVLLPFVEERVELTGARRCCQPGRLTMFGLGWTREVLSFPGFPESVEVTPEGDFDNTEPADSAAVESVAPQALPRESSRLNMVLGHRQIDFVQRRGLDALTGIQDVRQGWEAIGTVGLSLPLTSGEAPEDLFSALALFGGAAAGDWVLNSGASLEGRLVFATPGVRGGWRDVIGELDLYAYWRPSPTSRHTLLTRLSGAAGWSMVSPFQLTLGGEDMLRGYREDDFPGGQRVVLTVEDRILLPSPLEDLFDVGLTVFADAGAMWAGDVPFGLDSGLRGSVGAGVRLGFPPGTRRTVRFDLAWPVTGSVGIGDAIFRITADELISIVFGFEDRQLRRSRRSGIVAGLFDVR